MLARLKPFLFSSSRYQKPNLQKKEQEEEQEQEQEEQEEEEERKEQEQEEQEQEQEQEKEKEQEKEQEQEQEDKIRIRFSPNHSFITEIASVVSHLFLHMAGVYSFCSRPWGVF